MLVSYLQWNVWLIDTITFAAYEQHALYSDAWIYIYNVRWITFIVLLTVSNSLLMTLTHKLNISWNKKCSRLRKRRVMAILCCFWCKLKRAIKQSEWILVWNIGGPRSVAAHRILHSFVDVCNIKHTATIATSCTHSAVWFTLHVEHCCNTRGCAIPAAARLRSLHSSAHHLSICSARAARKLKTKQMFNNVYICRGYTSWHNVCIKPSKHFLPLNLDRPFL